MRIFILILCILCFREAFAKNIVNDRGVIFSSNISTNLLSNKLDVVTENFNDTEATLGANLDSNTQEQDIIKTDIYGFLDVIYEYFKKLHINDYTLKILDWGIKISLLLWTAFNFLNKEIKFIKGRMKPKTEKIYQKYRFSWHKDHYYGFASFYIRYYAQLILRNIIYIVLYYIFSICLYIGFSIKLYTFFVVILFICSFYHFIRVAWESILLLRVISTTHKFWFIFPLNLLLEAICSKDRAICNLFGRYNEYIERIKPSVNFKISK